MRHPKGLFSGTDDVRSSPFPALRTVSERPLSSSSWPIAALWDAEHRESGKGEVKYGMVSALRGCLASTPFALRATSKNVLCNAAL